MLSSYGRGSRAGRRMHLRAISTRALALGLTMAGASIDTALAQAAADPASGDDGMIVVTGSRRAARSVLDVPAPVDIVSAEDLQRQSSPDISNMLRTAVPSLNVNDNAISGTSAGIRPVTLRGLSPDHTLVLVNGKRQHRASDIPTFSGGISDGSQGPDMSSIPSIALKQVQVLRDGAAAQYGADAIAGVINFIMDDTAEGGRAELRFSSTYEGDGDTYVAAATYGTRLGDKGFIRFSGEYSDAQMTTRAVQRSDAAALQAAGFQDVPDPATRFGTPKVKDNIKTFVNMSVENGLGGEFYGFGGYAQRTVFVDFFYRNPTDRTAVFTDASGNYLIGDMTPDDGKTCPGGIDFSTGTVTNPIGVNDADAQARLAQVFADPNCYSALETYPGGYSPYFGNKIKDIYGTLGMKGEIIDDLTYDLSVGAGRHQMQIFVSNSLNPSLGSLSPTSFRNNGKRVQNEFIANADFTYPLEIGLASPLNVAAGAEFHRESFTVVAGQPESYEAGILASQGFLIGEDAYPGYTPDIAGTFSRNNVSAYLDLETNVTDNLVLGAATRYEHFTDFGDKVTYKLSGLYHITPALGLRSTYATGFHAPSPGQQNYSGLTTELTTDGELLLTGIIPAGSPVAAAVGGSALKPETSKSLSLGIVFEQPWLSLSIDYFRIKMKNRLTTSASYSLTDAQRAALTAEGYSFAANLGTFRFFTNDFDSTTEGVDIVATVPLKIVPGATTSFNLAANYTKTNVTSYDPSDPNELLSATRVIQLEKNLPRWRGNATISHDTGTWRMFVRGNYYGKYTEMHVNSSGLRIDAGSEITFDAELGYNILRNTELSVGAQNIFDNRPDLNPWRYILGSKYPTTSPMGVNGGAYYVQLKQKF